MHQSESRTSHVDTTIPPLKILITGGTGFIGTPLVTMLCESGCEVTVLTRDRKRASFTQPAAAVTWIESLNALASNSVFDVFINLAGESLAQGRWTDAKKQRLLDSRINVTAALLDLVGRLEHKPAYLINGSAVGFYGPHQDQKLDESSAAVDSFSHRLCAAWEAEADKLGEYGMGVCKLRLGVVLAPSGGAFEQLKRPFRLKVATQMGAGQHYFSWVHRQDLMRIFAFLLARGPENQWLTGPVNATAPDPVTYHDLCQALAERYRTWLKLPLPAPLLRTMLGEMADELLLTGQRVEPGKLLENGFRFQYPTLKDALTSLVGWTALT